MKISTDRRVQIVIRNGETKQVEEYWSDGDVKPFPETNKPDAATLDTKDGWSQCPEVKCYLYTSKCPVYLMGQTPCFTIIPLIHIKHHLIFVDVVH